MGPAIAFTGVAGVLGGLGFYLHKSGTIKRLLNRTSAANALIPPTSTPATPATPGKVEPPAANIPPPGKSATEINLGTVLKPGYPDYAAQVKVEGKAVAPAKALHAYLKMKGVEPETAELKALVLAFQKAHNADKLGKGLGGQVSEDGLYGPGTSGALTLYTNDPIAGNPKYQPRVATLGEVVTNKVIGENGSNAGVAYRSQFNLIQSLKNSGLTNSSNQAALIRQYQSDVNTDPLFPGPAHRTSPKPPILHPALSVDGAMGPKTKGVLLFGTSDDDFPAVAKALKSIAIDPGTLESLKKAGKPVHLL